MSKSISRSTTTTTTTTSPTPETLLSFTTPRGAAAFHRVEHRLRAVSASVVRPLKADPTVVVTTVLGAAPAIQTLRTRIAHELPSVDLAEIDALEDYALAFLYAQGRYLAASTPPDQVPVLLEQLTRERSSALIAADALVDAGVFTADRVAAIREGHGTRDAASDAVALASLYEDHAEQVQGITHFGPDRVRALRSLGERVFTALGWRENHAFDIDETRNTRDRAFTVLNDAYQSARRAVAFLRAEEGDADLVAPTFYTGGGRSRPAATDDNENTPGGGETTAGSSGEPAPAATGDHATTTQSGSTATGNPARIASPFVDE